MRKKGFLDYLYRLFYLVLVILLIVFIDGYFARLEQKFYRFELSYYRYYVLRLLSLVLIGIVLGLPRFIDECQKWGTWTCDSFRLTSLGLPLLLLRIFPLALLPVNNLPNSLAKLYNYLFLNSPTFNVLSGVALGYIIITSFTKKTYYV